MNSKISVFVIRVEGITLSNLLQIFFDSYSANTQNINATTLKINVIILFTKQVQEKMREELGVDQLCFLCHTSPLHFTQIEGPVTLSQKSRKSEYIILWQKFGKVSWREFSILSFFVLVTSILYTQNGESRNQSKSHSKYLMITTKMKISFTS